MDIKTFLIQKKQVVSKLINLLILISFGLFLLALLPENVDIGYKLGTTFGVWALYIYLLTITPGIIKRLNLSGVFKDVRIILVGYRRQLGVLSFLLVFYHYMLLRGLDLISTWKLTIPEDLFEILGFLAFQFMFLLFVTSNNFFVKKLGKWWGRVHSLTYVIVWFVFLHVALVTHHTYLIIITAVFLLLEMFSLTYSNFIKKNE